ncbi:MAG: oligosaccharide flippase family protein [Glaciecola sp.]|jgi:O-antigen/teichoic acid export membrane protein
MPLGIPKRLTDLTSIFGAKIGSIVIGIVFLPLYDRLLGIEQFGVLALIISLQSLVVMLDLGMATIVGRDAALQQTKNPKSYLTWRDSEANMSLLYVLILVIVVCVSNLIKIKTLSTFELVLIVILFWSLIIQNVAYSALNGLQAYKTSSYLQVLGTVFRAVSSLMALKFISPSLDVFILTQCICSILHMILTRLFCDSRLTRDSRSEFKYSLNFNRCFQLAKRGRALIVFSISGALVMHFDKSIISFFMSPSSLVPYFYAFSLAMLPLSVLAGPTRQYFQPKVLTIIFAKERSLELKSIVRMFALALTFMVAIPSTIVWVWAEFFVVAWLGDNPAVEQVIEFLKILLPAAAVGSLGYIPYVFLLAVEDYSFQAKFSVVMTSIVLLLVTVSSFNFDLMWVCVSYFSYHAISTIGLWIRAYNMTLTRQISVLSAIYCLVSLTFMVVIVFLFVFLFNIKV